MTVKNDKYPILPHIAYGLCEDVEGLYFLLPITPISLNTYKKMHWGAVKKEKEHVKAIIDVILASCIKREYIKSFTKDGLSLSKPLIDKCTATWFLTFLNHGVNRDTDNFVQKIFMDALVMSGVLFDDNEKYVTSTTVEFKKRNVNTACIFFNGKVNKEMFLESVKVVKYESLINFLDGGED
jgi:Holliday junction resolvase RusA-like endonuclease